MHPKAWFALQINHPAGFTQISKTLFILRPPTHTFDHAWSLQVFVALKGHLMFGTGWDQV